jgi:hypothetical protein
MKERIEQLERKYRQRLTLTVIGMMLLAVGDAAAAGAACIAAKPNSQKDGIQTYK